MGGVPIGKGWYLCDTEHVVRACETRLDVQVDAARVSKVKASTWGSMRAQENVTVPIADYEPVSALEANEKKDGAAPGFLPPVTNYGFRTRSNACQDSQSQLTFLRRVEQVCALSGDWDIAPVALLSSMSGCTAADSVYDQPHSLQQEWATRVPEERGIRSIVLSHKGLPISDVAEDTSYDPNETTLFASITLNQSESHWSTDSRHLALSNVENGLCGLLYSPLQLYLPRRKRVQAALLAEEAAAVRHHFNEQFASTQNSKRQCLDGIAERVARINELQKDLSVLDVAVAPLDGEAEDVEAHVLVRDSDVPVPKWLSAADRCEAILERG